MTPYYKLQAHLAKHAYKRGQFQGDAPADYTRRSHNHVRVLRVGDAMVVRMYRTNILTVTPENRIILDTGGWWTSTTRANLNDALSGFIRWGTVCSINIFHYSQQCIRVGGKTYRFYDGMEFDAEGRLLSPAQFFERKQTDKAATAKFRKDMAESGFKAVWPVLFAAAEPDPRLHVPAFGKLLHLVTREYHANQWPNIAAAYKARYDDHKKALAAIVRKCTRDMTEIVKTDVTVV